MRIARYGNQRYALALEYRQNAGKFFAFAAVADGQHHILHGDHAQIAMAGFSWVHEKGGRAGRCQRGGNFAPDMAAFAHAHHHHPAGCLQHGGYGLRQLRGGCGVLKACGGLLQGGRFDGESFLYQLQGALVTRGGVRIGRSHERNCTDALFCMPCSKPARRGEEKQDRR